MKLLVTVPPNTQPGQTIAMEVNGQTVHAQIPQGLTPGMQFHVEIPDQPAQPAQPQAAPKVPSSNNPAQSGSNTRKVEVTVPAGAGPGAQLRINVEGESHLVPIPDGATPGSKFFAMVEVGAGTNVPTASEAPTAAPSMSREMAPAINGNLHNNTGMVSLQLDPNNPETYSLSNIFGGMEALMIEQKFHASELLGWEQRNEYRIYPYSEAQKQITGGQVLHVTEDSGCMERQCCGPQRQCRLDIRFGTTPDGPVIGTMVKDFHMNLCGFFLRPKLMVVDANGLGFGRVYDPCRCFDMTQNVYDRNDNIIYKIHGACCQMGNCVVCVEVRFTIKDVNGQPVGAIYKPFNGFDELCTRTNKFVVEFPKDANSEHRAALLGATFLLDFEYFERKQQ